MRRLSTVGRLVGLLASTLVLAGGFALPAQAVQVDPPWNLDRIDQAPSDRGGWPSPSPTSARGSATC